MHTDRQTAEHRHYCRSVSSPVSIYVHKNVGQNVCDNGDDVDDDNDDDDDSGYSLADLDDLVFTV